MAEFDFIREVRTPYSECYTILEGDGVVGRIDIHYADAVVHATLTVAESLTNVRDPGDYRPDLREGARRLGDRPSGRDRARAPGSRHGGVQHAGVRRQRRRPAAHRLMGAPAPSFRRRRQHNNDLVEGFTKRYGVHRDGGTGPVVPAKAGTQGCGEAALHRLMGAPAPSFRRRPESRGVARLPYID